MKKAKFREKYYGKHNEEMTKTERTLIDSGEVIEENAEEFAENYAKKTRKKREEKK